jgi:hypothetical protein
MGECAHLSGRRSSQLGRSRAIDLASSPAASRTATPLFSLRQPVHEAAEPSPG